MINFNVPWNPLTSFTLKMAYVALILVRQNTNISALIESSIDVEYDHKNTTATIYVLRSSIFDVLTA